MGLTLAALGVVYGDIGTSPLYAFRESLGEHYDIAVTRPNVLGVLSLIFWALVMVIGIKYVVFVLRADNHGEGGILALTALISGPQGHLERSKRRPLSSSASSGPISSTETAPSRPPFRSSQPSKV